MTGELIYKCLLVTKDLAGKNTDMAWQRARNPEQKAERRAEILDATARLFETAGLEGASLNAIAAEAGISKGNIYRYFESREEIFLHLLLSDYREWVTSVERALSPLAGSGDLEAVARALAASYLSRPRFGSLVAAANSVLERNVTVEAVVWFKTELLEVAIRLGNAVHAAIPALQVEGAQRFLTYGHFLVAGLWPAAHPPPAVAEALERPELGYACVQPERDLEGALLVMLRGLLATS